MAYRKSILDILSDKISPKLRKWKDIGTRLHGTKTDVLRIKKDSVDSLGEETFSYQSQVISNVILRYPFSNVEMFASKDSTTARTNFNVVELYDLLPVNMYIPFEMETSGTINPEATEPIEIDENDLIIDVVYDYHRNSIPLVMQVGRVYGALFGKNQINRRYEMNLMRGDMEPAIQTIIDTYVSGQVGI
jgi:hypothetical protein